MIFSEFLPHLIFPGRVAAFMVASILVHGCLFRSASRVLHAIGEHTPSPPSFLRPSRTKGGQRLKPVAVKVYVEALCIDCKHYMLEDLIGTFDTLGPSVMDLSVVAFGNAKLDNSTQAVTCQHGDAECDANSYLQCAISLYPTTRYMPFLDCLYNTMPMGKRDLIIPRSTFATCARRAALDWNTIRICHDDPRESWRLQLEASQKTPSYHNHVPWVEVDGHYVSEKSSLLQAVCDVYAQNGGKDPACVSPSKQ